MPVELIALPPLAFALWLLACVPGVLENRPVRERAGIVMGAAVLLGPLALALLGLFLWLLLIVVATLALTGWGARRRADRVPRRANRVPGRLSGHGRWAVPRP